MFVRGNFSLAASEVLEHCSRAGAEVEFSLLRQLTHMEEGLAHRLAAFEGVEPAGTDSAALVGRQISLAQFYGPRYDPSSGVLGPPTTSWSGGYFLGDRGFVDALLEPPHGLMPATVGALDRALDGKALLEAVIRDVLHRPGKHTAIWHWNGDWSSYFDAGREGWGASAWTIRTGESELVAVAASATD